MKLALPDSTTSLLSEFKTNPKKLVAYLCISAFGNVMIIATVNSALNRDAEAGSFMLSLLFMLSILIYITAQKSVMADAALTAEQTIAGLRKRVLANVRKADMAAMQIVGRAPIYAAVTREAQTISNTLPMVVVGAQQSVLLLFMSIYIISLSTVAFILIGLFGIFAIAFHVFRIRLLQQKTDAQIANQNDFFETFRGMLDGVKEMSFNAARRDAVVADVVEQSAKNQQMATDIKRIWAREFVSTQALFYVLLGLMVFVVPIFTENYHSVVIQVTMAALFMIGPLSSLAQAIPAVTDLMRALQNIYALETHLGTVTRQTKGEVDEDTQELDVAGQSLSLNSVTYSYHDTQGQVTFALQPIDAIFKSGEIAFITGGNGSGKSTLFRLLTGIARPETGEVRLDGAVVVPEQYGAYRDRIGVVFADFYLFRRIYGQEDADHHRVSSLLDQFGLTGKTELIDGTFTTTDLSAGQRKRLALVITILQDTPIIMLDEWAADQDSQFRAKFYHRILPSLAAEGRIVICITHDETYFGTAQVLYAMVDGCLRKQTKGRELT
jgi:putative ATP-binding cassette transporter